MTDLLSLAHAADHASDWARHCLADIDAGRGPKLGTPREYVERLRAEIEVFEAVQQDGPAFRAIPRLKLGREE